MKNILLVLFAVILLAACSSAPTQRTIDFENGCSVTLPSDWDVVPGDDTMPNTIMAVAPNEDGYRSQMRIDALRPFNMEKGETALKLKESLESRGALLGNPQLVKISGEPAVAYAWSGKENSTENALLTVDVTHYGYFVCGDENIYSLDFSCLTSQADAVKGVVDEAVYSFQTAGSKKRARQAELARIKAEKEAEAEKQAALEAERKAQAEESAFAAAEEEAAAIEAEAAAETEAVKEETVDAKAAAQKKVEAARKEAEKAQEAAVAKARAAKEAAKVAQAKAEALSAAQTELDELNGTGFVQLQQPEVVVKEETVVQPVQPVQPTQPTQPAQPTFFESEVTVTPQPQSMEIKVTTPQQTAPAAPAAPSTPAAPQTSPMKKTNGGLVIEMQTIN